MTRWRAAPAAATRAWRAQTGVHVRGERQRYRAARGERHISEARPPPTNSVRGCTPRACTSASLQRESSRALLVHPAHVRCSRAVLACGVRVRLARVRSARASVRVESRLLVRTSAVKFGSVFPSDSEIRVTLLLCSRSVFNRFKTAMHSTFLISLSERSMTSNWSCVAARFSITAILLPASRDAAAIQVAGCDDAYIGW